MKKPRSLIVSDKNNKFIYLWLGEVVNVRTIAKHYPANAMRRMMFSTRYFGKGSEDGGPGFEEEEHVSSLFTMLNLKK